MIHISALVKGEEDTDPFAQIFSYTDSSDEKIFYNTVEIIKNKLEKNLKINVNESLIFYCAYIVEQIRERRPIKIIEKKAQKILNEDNVLIGVPESIRKITFEVSVDYLPKRMIVFEEPIKSRDYILASEK